MIFEVVKYRIDRWTWALFGTKVLLDLAFAVPLAWLALSDRLLNPALAERLSWLAEADNRKASAWPSLWARPWSWSGT